MPCFQHCVRLSPRQSIEPLDRAVLHLARSDFRDAQQAKLQHRVEPETSLCPSNHLALHSPTVISSCSCSSIVKAPFSDFSLASPYTTTYRATSDTDLLRGLWLFGDLWFSLRCGEPGSPHRPRTGISASPAAYRCGLLKPISWGFACSVWPIGHPHLTMQMRMRRALYQMRG